MLKYYFKLITNINPSYKNLNYKKTKIRIIKYIKKKFIKKNNRVELNENISFYHPKVSFGNITSLNLLEIDELFIFRYYLKNYKLYDQFIDIGANIGTHSIINAKLGLKVLSFEPDPWHINLLKKNIKKNKISKIKLFKYAVSNNNKKTSFTRVLGNTTGSHISGSKKNVYNEIEKFNVNVLSAKNIIKANSLIKIDAEGEEAKILLSLNNQQFSKNDFICEIGSKNNAKKIYQKLKKENINSYAQKINFRKVKNFSDLPISYKEGSLFISLNNLWKV